MPYRQLKERYFENAIGQAVSEELAAGEWLVWRRYVPELIGEDDAYVIADPNSRRYITCPLQESGLFLEFARLADEEITPQRWYEWIHIHGVLGLDWRDAVGESTEVGLHGPVRMEGGIGESYKNFVYEAKKANRVLRHYEAATSPIRGAEDILEAGLQDLPAYDERFGFKDERVRAAAMLSLVRGDVSVEIEDCYPTMILQENGGRSVQGWGFRTLLSAMYMQMFWLIVAPEEHGKRCLNPTCGRIFPLEQNSQASGSRKTRSDKKYCSDNCRGLYNFYKNR